MVQRILTGELRTLKEAFAAFNTQLAEEKPSDTAVAHIDTPYSNQFTVDHGNLAASAVYNTVLAEADVDLVFGQSCYISSDVYAGDYTKKDLGYLINNDVGKPVIARLTGEQLFDLVSNTLSLKGNRGAVCNDSTLYVSVSYTHLGSGRHGECQYSGDYRSSPSGDRGNHGPRLLPQSASGMYGNHHLSDV